MRQTRRQGVTHQVIDRDQRLARAQRQGLGGGQSHHDAADQAGSGGDGDAVQFLQGNFGLVQCALNDVVQYFQMGARGDFGHHTAIGGMGFGLAEHDIGQDFARPRGTPAHHRRRGFVATGFNAQKHERLVRHGPLLYAE